MVNKNIILCGFMGCGKTTIGKLVAKKINMDFVDLDIYIEQKQDMTVSDIFAKYGEAYFRQLERQATVELSQMNNKVIAAGGGTLIFKENVDVFKNSGVIILIDASLKAISERLKYDNTRPLLARPDKEKAMKELYEKRLPIYKSAADLIINGNNSPEYVCMDIINSIQN